MKKIICILLIIIHSLVIGNWSFVIADDLSAAAPAKAEYRLAPNDQLEIKIIGQKDLDTKQTIAPDGTISLPLLGRITAQDRTLTGFNKYLSDEFSRYIKNPQVVVYLTPRPIYIVQHDLKKNTWDVKEAKSIDEAKAYMGPVSGASVGANNYSPISDIHSSAIHHGDVIAVEINKKPDFFEANWYKIITATAVVVGVYSTLRK